MKTWKWLVLLVLAGCAKAKEAPRYVQEPSYDAPASESAGGYAGDYGSSASLADEDSRAPRRSISAKKEAYAGAPAPPPPPPSAAPMDMLSEAEPPPTATVTEPSPDRMIHYEGWARLRVANPRDTLEQVVAVADAIGGRTENMAGNVVTVRVPVARFDEAWEQVLALGDVMDRSVRADDITEQFTAIDLRARTLRETQARLVELLAKSKDEDEKLRLLQELTRVSEQLDALESQLRTLSDLAGFSRITVEAVPREAFTASGGRPPLSGFEWIPGLSPFRRSVWDDDHRIELPVPDGMVGLATRGPFVAESADGTVLWTMRVENEPLGTAAFWSSAIEDRLAEEFANPQRSRLGAWECLAVDQPASDEPYRWQICVQPAGRHLEVVQAFYPSPAQVARYQGLVEAAIGGKGGGA